MTDPMHLKILAGKVRDAAVKNAVATIQNQSACGLIENKGPLVNTGPHTKIHLGKEKV